MKSAQAPEPERDACACQLVAEFPQQIAGLGFYVGNLVGTERVSPRLGVGRIDRSVKLYVEVGVLVGDGRVAALIEGEQGFGELQIQPVAQVPQDRLRIADQVFVEQLSVATSRKMASRPGPFCTSFFPVTGRSSHVHREAGLNAAPGYVPSVADHVYELRLWERLRQPLDVADVVGRLVAPSLFSMFAG